MLPDRRDYVLIEFHCIATNIEIPVLIVSVDADSHPLLGEDDEDPKRPNRGKSGRLRNIIDNELGDRYERVQFIDVVAYYEVDRALG